MSTEYEDITAPEADDTVVDINDTAPMEDKAPADEYYAIPKATKICSILSLISAVLAVLLCPIYYVGIALGFLAIVLAVVSSMRLGYFDSLSVVGLIIGIFGLIFSVFVLILDLTGVLALFFGIV